MKCKTLMTNINFIIMLPGNIVTKYLEIKIFNLQNSTANKEILTFVKLISHFIIANDKS